jgi:asparagine synthase (glutamine-hydrolysing)
MVMTGKIFGGDEKKVELIRRGHVFQFEKSDAEFILHSLEEWGHQCLADLNGVFAFALYDIERRTLTIANDRYGMKPVYYYYKRPSITFASTISAILEDDRVKREINWEAWREFFCYGYVLGTKTFFKNIHSLRNGTILTVTSDEVLSRNYWNYASIRVDYEKTEEQFIDTGAKLARRAIQRHCIGLQRCTVLISGGYDSRCIAGAISRYTSTSLETFTTRSFTTTPWSAKDGYSYVDAALGREVAKRLRVPNTYVTTPSNLWQKYFIQKTLLVDGMCHEHLWMLPLVDRLPRDKVVFDGLGGDVLLKGQFLTRNSLMHTHDLEKLAGILDRQMRGEETGPDIVSDFFCSPAREGLQSAAYSLLEELSRFRDHENIITLFSMENRERNSVSLLSNNIVGSRVPVILPFLDNELVEFSLSIPPLMKIESQIYFRILKRLLPDIMRIPSTNFGKTRLLYDLKGLANRHFLLFVLQKARYAFAIRVSDTRRKLQREAIKYLLDLVRSMESPPFLDVNKVSRVARDCLRMRKPSPLELNALVAVAEFCIWYNRYFHETPSSNSKG